jgi:hypothetical protein
LKVCPEDEVDVASRHIVSKVPKIPTQQETVEHEGQSNSIVAGCIDLYQHKCCSWEDCLMLAVRTLVEANESLASRLLKALAEIGPGTVPVSTDMQDRLARFIAGEPELLR